MVYYNYKRVSEQIPKEFRNLYEKLYKEQIGYDFEGGTNHDGDLWLLTASYIDYLQYNMGLVNEQTFTEYFENRAI